MSSSTFIQRWTSVNDLTTEASKNNSQSNPFFLRPKPASTSASSPPTLPSLSTLQISQSLISLVELPTINSEDRCQLSRNRLFSPRVATIIRQFESQAVSLMNNPTKVSSPIRSVFVKKWEDKRKNGNSLRTPPIVVVETSSSSSFTSKKNNNNIKPQPIIICEKITNNNRLVPPPVSPKSPLTKTWSQLKLMSQQQPAENIENVTDSSIHRMVNAINNGNKDCVTLSRSSTSATTDSTCSSSCSSSSNAPSPPRFTRPTIASTQKQRQFISNVTCFKRTNSPSPSITTFTRTVSSTPSIILPLCSINEDLEQQQTQISMSSSRFCSSDVNLVEQNYPLLATQTISSEPNLSQNSITEALTINTNLPLRYKRESLIRLYG